MYIEDYKVSFGLIHYTKNFFLYTHKKTCVNCIWKIFLIHVQSTTKAYFYNWKKLKALLINMILVVIGVINIFQEIRKYFSILTKF